jgi:hypothetical protein
MYRMAWTDERMDDFAKHTDRRFDAVDRRLDRIEQHMDAGFERVDRRFEQIDAHFQGLHQTIHRTVLQLGVSLVVTIGIGFAGVVATQL